MIDKFKKLFGTKVKEKISDDLNQEVEAEWDFGDGASSTELDPTHVASWNYLSFVLFRLGDRKGAVHASVRKGLAMGISRAELEQVVALCAGTLGFPQTVAAYTWIKDLL